MLQSLFCCNITYNHSYVRISPANAHIVASYTVHNYYNAKIRIKSLTIFCALINCDRILENSSKSHMKSNVFLHVFNDISTYEYVLTEYFLHSFSNLSIEFHLEL